jgi:hypothetical protein
MCETLRAPTAFPVPIGRWVKRFRQRDSAREKAATAMSAPPR